MNHVLMNVGGVHVNKSPGKFPALSDSPGIPINSKIIIILVVRVLLLACFTHNSGGNHPVWKFF